MAKTAENESLGVLRSDGNHETQNGDSQVTLKDGLVSESFVLFLYGISLAAIGFLCEILVVGKVDFRLEISNA